jgi:hypothetical protein
MSNNMGERLPMGFLITTLSHEFRTRTTAALEPYDLSTREFGLLVRLLHHGTLTQSKLGQLHHTDRTSMVSWARPERSTGLPRLLDRSRSLDIGQRRQARGGSGARHHRIPHRPPTGRRTHAADPRRERHPVDDPSLTSGILRVFLCGIERRRVWQRSHRSDRDGLRHGPLDRGFDRRHRRVGSPRDP